VSAPPPIITNLETTSAWDEKWYPSGPRSLAALARTHGWDVRMGFSRGYVPGAREGTYELRDTIGVWMDGYGRRAAAFWERNPDAQFSARKLETGVEYGEIPSGMTCKASHTTIYVQGGGVFSYASLSDLKEWITARGEVRPFWCESVRARVLMQNENARARARAAPVHKKEKEHA
jgi:hypothetical protein